MPIATVLAILQACVALEPLLADVIPVIEKMLAGQTVTEADVATLDATETAINAKLAAQVAAAG